MAQLRDSQIRRSLTTLIAPRRVRALARELGVVRRRRKVDVVALVYALVLGYAASAQRSLAGLRRAYQQATARRLAPSAFYDRFSVRLARLLKQLVSYPPSDLQQADVLATALADAHAAGPTTDGIHHHVQLG